MASIQLHKQCFISQIFAWKCSKGLLSGKCIVHKNPEERQFRQIFLLSIVLFFF